jgi:DNA-binding NarL/FixJ family response regulator
VRVLIIDGHAIFRQGIATALAAPPERHDVVQASDVDEARKHGALSAIDVMLVDVELPGAIELLRHVRDQPSPKALVCSGPDDADRVIVAIEAGAIGYLSKDTLTPERLTAAIRSVSSGSGVLAPDLLSGVLRRISEASRTILEPRGLTLSRLSSREQQVLRLVAAGHATREVAQRMSYSERTVKNVLHDVAAKLNAKTRSQAVAFAIREGLI